MWVRLIAGLMFQICSRKARVALARLLRECGRGGTEAQDVSAAGAERRLRSRLASENPVLLEIAFELNADFP
jgi:hypothetical protein